LKIDYYFLDETGSESDVQDQQPTEATDDSKYFFELFPIFIINFLGNLPNQLQIDPVETTIESMYYFIIIFCFLI